jgi:glycosyltransferase involved in cell wall biosynthesis
MIAPDAHPDVLLVGDLASIHVRRLAAGLTDVGLRVVVAAFEGDPIAGVGIVRLSGRPASDDRRYLTAVPRLARVIRARRPRIVNAHYVSSYGLMTALAMRLAHPFGARPALVQTAWGTDLLVTAHDSTARRALARLTLRSADLVTSDSLELAGAAAGLAPHTPHHRFVFGPDRATFEREHRPAHVVLSTRRLDPDTRIPTVIDGFRQARDEDPERLTDWRLVVAGSGRDADEVTAYAAGDAAIDLVGQLTADELAEHLASADLLVSIPVSDGTSAALLEGMAAGVMPLVNDLPANREWVDGSVGLILPRDPSSADVAAAIRQAIADRIPAATIRERARPATWEDEVERLVAAFEALRPDDSGPHPNGLVRPGPSRD